MGHGTNLRQRAEDWDARRSRREPDPTAGLESPAEEEGNNEAQEDAGNENGVESHGDNAGGASTKCSCKYIYMGGGWVGSERERENMFMKLKVVIIL